MRRKHLFDKVRYDSKIEKQFATDMDMQDAIELYVKLPSGFYINTPMGKYNPDWAIVFKKGIFSKAYILWLRLKAIQTNSNLKE